jgi:hypothetical protein
LIGILYSTLSSRRLIVDSQLSDSHTLPKRVNDFSLEISTFPERFGLFSVQKSPRHNAKHLPVSYKPARPTGDRTVLAGLTGNLKERNQFGT